MLLVKRQQPKLFLDPLGIEPLQRFGNAPMGGTPFTPEQPAVGMLQVFDHTLVHLISFDYLM
jgi:hypothetical protein